MNLGCIFITPMMRLLTGTCNAFIELVVDARILQINEYLEYQGPVLDFERSFGVRRDISTITTIDNIDKSFRYQMAKCSAYFQC